MSPGSKKGRTRLSRPKEHGGLVTLGGAALVAAALAPEPWVGFTAASVYALAYMARGPVEQIVRGARRKPWDVPALFLYASAMAVAGILVSWDDALAGAVLVTTALAIPIAGAVARQARAHRSFLVELVGMSACGASTGVSLYAGGLSAVQAAALGASMMAYAAAAVPIVRCETRRRGDEAPRGLAWLGVAGLALGAAAVALVAPRLAPAFAPRGMHALVRAIWGQPKLPIHAVAVRESVELLVFVALLVLTF